MIDIHAHLLPGIDDGPETLSAAVELCRAALAEGCTDLIATPHQHHELWWNGDRRALARLLARLQEALGTAPRLHLGAEIRVGDRLLPELDRHPHGEVVSLAGSRYLLIEFDRYQPDPDAAALIHELVVGGWRPILAHPEEIPWMGDDLPLVERLVERGATVQLTASSVTGKRSRGSHDRAWSLIDAGLAHFVASDTHNLSRRPPGLTAAFEEISRRADEALAWRLTRDHPAAILADRPLASGDSP